MSDASTRSAFQHLLACLTFGVGLCSAPVCLVAAVEKPIANTPHETARGKTERIIIELADQRISNNHQGKSERVKLASSDSIQAPYGTNASTQSNAAKQLITKIDQAFGVSATWVRAMSGSSIVLSVQPLANKSAFFDQLRALPEVVDVASDAITRTSTVDDERYAEQWQLHSSELLRASLNMPQAWDITHGSAGVVVAVVDTGIDYNHPDLTGRLLPGYDFVSSIVNSVDEGIVVPESQWYLRSHDGDGPDPDASDPGDAIDETLRAEFDALNMECYVGNSSWHGTAMASIIAANVNNGIGMAGIDRHAKILPVRAIGKCGGHRSDMIDAIRWAAGVDDPSLPPNPTPARIINLSLGIDDLCTSMDQRAIDEAVAAGAIVVAAVGNNGRNTDAQPSSPSHCQNVIGVMAIDQHGYKASYSNFGRDADIGAPGGGIAPSPYSILVATNNGTSDPIPEFGYRTATGTSVAAPHVAGVLALMLSVNPDLSNEALEALMLDNARAFPGEEDAHYAKNKACDVTFCGAGILDAYTAVLAVDTYQPGVLLDSPALAAAQSMPVTVGAYTGFGCTVSMKAQGDPMLLLLCAIASLLLIRRRARTTSNLSRV